jgi:beta-lactamase superfamily II metal-dependent hydrolase
MGYEIDFLAVGEESQSGDAIAIRFGDLKADPPEQFVMVVDGGFQDTGEELVDLIKTHYKTTEVDLVVSTHPDGDHAGGLKTILEELIVKKFWMHRPWLHSENLRGMFHDGRITDNSLSTHMIRSLNAARDLEKIAEDNDIPIDEPFSGNGADSEYPELTILGPSVEFYESLLPDFRSSPDAKAGVGVLAKASRAVAAVAEAVTKIAENWWLETLTDPKDDATSAENNSSTVIHLQIDDRSFLFTADAGVPALDPAIDYAESAGVDTKKCFLVQIPHHGSKRNVGPTILDRMLGEKHQEPAADRLACASAAKKGEPKHPAKKVTNAYQRRGSKGNVHATQGCGHRYSRDAPTRPGWGSSVTPLPFYDEVEE